MGPLPLCVVLLVQANRNDASDRCLGPAAECECALVCECECECGCACYCECECECVSGMFQMRWVARRFTPVCRSRCGARGADRGPGAGRFVRCLDQSPCVWFCLCRRIEKTIPTVVWDQQRSRCEARRREALFGSTPSGEHDPGWAVPAATSDRAFEATLPASPSPPRRPAPRGGTTRGRAPHPHTPRPTRSTPPHPPTPPPHPPHSYRS